jgi:ribulose 1,5-bisphosphate carboxylase large subunit-like protein
MNQSIVPCGDKRESIRSAVLGIYTTVKMIKDDERIDDQEFVLITAHLKKIEQCVNLACTIGEMERHLEEIEREINDKSKG